MLRSGFNTGLPGTVIGGAPGFGFAGSPLIGGGDVDPITPGYQAQPGVLTATGPSVVVPGGATLGGAAGYGNSILTSGYGGVGGFGGIGYGASSGIVDADPITPGVQAQAGIVTPTGPPRVVSGPGALGMASGIAASGYRGVGGVGVGGLGVGNVGFSNVNTNLAGGFAAGGIDADPITPGIQSQPGVVTPIGPSKVISQGTGFVNGAGYASGVNYASGVYGTRTGTGYVGYRNCACCPWWLWTILGLLLLAGIIGGLYAFNSEKKGHNLKTTRTTSNNDETTTAVTSKNEDDNNDENTSATKTTDNDNSNDNNTITTQTENKTTTAPSEG